LILKINFSVTYLLPIFKRLLHCFCSILEIQLQKHLLLLACCPVKASKFIGMSEVYKSLRTRDPKKAAILSMGICTTVGSTVLEGRIFLDKRESIKPNTMVLPRKNYYAYLKLKQMS